MKKSLSILREPTVFVSHTYDPSLLRELAVQLSTLNKHIYNKIYQMSKIENYTIRKLVANDYDQFSKLINEFRPTEFSRPLFEQILTAMSQSNTEIWTVEYTTTDNDVIKYLVATGTIIYETKFIHNCGMCAHIEDICVQEAFRKHGFGSILMRHLVETAKLKGAYKIILDCSEELEGFYLKHGFHKHGLQMANYLHS